MYSTFRSLPIQTGCRSLLALLSIAWSGNALLAQTLTAEFVNAGYSLVDLGSPVDLPAPYGGLTIRADDPNTLYIGGNANNANGTIYTVPLIRDGVTNQITGFAGPAVFHSTGPNNDGGLTFTPSGTLLFTQYTPFSMNSMGQILPDNSYVTTQLTSLGVSASVGSHAFVPDGYPGAGGLIVASYNASIAYRLPFAVDGSGLYTFSAPTSSVNIGTMAQGPEGIAYVPLGSNGFPSPSMVISAYGMNKVVVFEVGPDGLPDVATVRDMVIDLTGAEGAWIDPLTGDFIFSTFSFGGVNRVVRVTGFEVPTAIRSQEAAMGTFQVHPNPTSGLFSIDFAHAEGTKQLEIIDPLGAVVRSELATGLRNVVDLSGQAPGIYTIRVRRDSAEHVLRVLVE